MWYWIIRFGFLVILRVFFRFRIEGKDNIPLKTNFIVVANHCSFADSTAVGAAIPRKIHWMAYKVPWLKWLLGKTEAFSAGGSLELASQLLLEGKSVGIFPEGFLSRTGELGEFRKGAALLAIRTGRPIVPCAVIGSHRVLPRRSNFPRLGPLKVRIGKPIYLLKEYGDTIDEVSLWSNTNRMREAVKELLYAG